MTRLFRTAPAELKGLERGERKGIARMLVSVVGNVDDYGDRIVPGAFDRSLAEWRSSGRPIPVVYSHQWSDPRAHVGMVTDAREVEVDGKRGLLTVQQYDLYLPPEQSYARQVFHLLEQGRLTQASIGYIVRGERVTVDEESGQPVRELTDLDLIEVGPCLLGANRETDLLEVASALGAKARSGALPYRDLPLADRDRAWDARGAVDRVWEWAGGDDDLDPGRFALAFLWRDPEADPKTRGAYKLPIADVVDGELVAVPRAIFAAAAVLQGARGGADIPEEDIARCRAHLERYYEKLGMEPPWAEKAAAGDTRATLPPELIELLIRPRNKGV